MNQLINEQCSESPHQFIDINIVLTLAPPGTSKPSSVAHLQHSYIRGQQVRSVAAIISTTSQPSVLLIMWTSIALFISLVTSTSVLRPSHSCVNIALNLNISSRLHPHLRHPQVSRYISSHSRHHVPCTSMMVRPTLPSFATMRCAHQHPAQ